MAGFRGAVLMQTSVFAVGERARVAGFAVANSGTAFHFRARTLGEFNPGQAMARALDASAPS